MKNYLDFEKEIKALEQEVDGLKSPFGSEGISEVDTNKIKKKTTTNNKTYGKNTNFHDFIYIYIYIYCLKDPQ